MGVKRNLEEAGLSGNDKNITEDEAALYDRQIRLWGMECQKRLREAKILVVGLNGVGAEIVKNLTLTGMKSIYILDDSEVSDADRTAQFFVSASPPGAKRAEASLPAIRELNPNVDIQHCTGDIFNKSDDFFNYFDAMVATDCSEDQLIKLNALCRKYSIQFYCAETWGFYGFCFLDLAKHTCRCTVLGPPKVGAKGKKPPTREETKKYCPFAQTLQLKCGSGLKKRVSKVFILLHVINRFREKFNRFPNAESLSDDVEQLIKIRKMVCDTLEYDESKISDEMLRSLFGQLSPVCAAVGGILANEIIKGISKTGLPVYNYFLFDGNDCVGFNETIIFEAEPEQSEAPPQN